MPGYGDAWGDAPYGDPPITQPTVLAYGAATGSGTSRTTASFAVAANRVVVFCCQATSSTSFPAEPPVLSGTMAGLNWTYQTRGHENGTWPRQSWMWSAFTGASPVGPGTMTWTTTNTMGANGQYSVVQFEEDEVDTVDPIVRPSGYFPELPPDNGNLIFAVRHQLAERADVRNGFLDYILLGANNSSSVVTTATGFTRLAMYQTGSSWGSITQWNPNQSYLIDNAWPSGSGGVQSHYVSVAAEIRAAGTDNSVGRIRDRPLMDGASTTNGTTFVTGAFTSFHERDLWLAVTSERSGATPGQPTITDTLGLTWTLAESIGYHTIASSTQKLWLFHARTGLTDPGADTVTITYPQSQESCAWQISETRFTNASSARTQTNTNAINSSGVAGFSTTFTNPCLSSGSVMFFLAKADNDRAAGADVITGTQETGYVEHEQSGASTPSIAISAFARHTPEDTPSIALRQNADAAMIAVEFAFDASTSVTTLDAEVIDAVPQLFTPKVNESVSVAATISVVPQLFTPASGTTSFAQFVRLDGGTFQGTAFDDDTFDIGTGQIASHSPSLFAPSTGTVDAKFVYTPAPGATIAAFQQDAFDDDTFQQNAANEGISHIPSLNAPSSVALTQPPAKFVYLTGIGGWDSPLVVWDDPAHVWDEGNIGGLILQSPQVFTPQIRRVVLPDLIDVTPTLYTPSVAPKSLTIPLIQHLPALFDHKVNMTVFEQDIISLEPELFLFRIQAPIEPDLIDHSPELFTPTVDPKTVEMDLIQHIPAGFDHKVNMSVLPDLIDATPTLYGPFVGLFISPIDLIDATPVVYTPSLERIFMDLIDAQPELFEPVKVNLPVNTVINFEFIDIADHSPELFAPDNFDIGQPKFVVAEMVDATPLILAPFVFTPTRPTIVLHARYDPVTVLHARYDPVILKHAQNTRQGA